MEQPVISFTAVYLEGDHGYDGFIEELPEVNTQGRTIEETRKNLRRLMEIIFNEKRAPSAELLRCKVVVREQFLIPILPAMRAVRTLAATAVELPAIKKLESYHETR